MKTRTFWMQTFLLTGALGLSGCGGSLSFAPVSGTVTLNGKPLEGAAVVFTPAPDNLTGTSGMDSTGPEGNYKAQHDGRFGLVPGKYVVLVSKEHKPGGQADLFKVEDESGQMVEDTEMERVAMESMAQGGGAPLKAVKVNKVEETFEREIPPEGGVFDFDLKAKAEDAKVLRGE
ncbi:MAG TPA: carboxypeptidase-like regulatory domain-containing protein [Isosphaeraceae bacterium]|nr:carboxypeptidase-like regulatory domain-containing protein [Isosphaeraceae bacterium]